jgi:triphosphoribosyl-dephospho-CoA synthase
MPLANVTIADAYYRACLDELRAPKAGNVHDFADGHDMSVGDFELSAEVTREWIAQPGASVGKRVRGAIAATRAAVGCNTNLGIVLMSAPIALAAERCDAQDLRAQTGRVLEGLSLHDAAQVFEAIVLAQPAGLGSAPEHDVREPATAPLLEVMRSAERRDRIAWNYSHGLADVFDIGIPTLRQALSKWDNWLWAVAAAHFAFMSAFPDTNIFRGHGPDAAEAARLEAAKIHARLLRVENPQSLLGDVLALDGRLKTLGHNPGTSADLTVATVFAFRLSDRLRSAAKDD